MMTISSSPPWSTSDKCGYLGRKGWGVVSNRRWIISLDFLAGFNRNLNAIGFFEGSHWLAADCWVSMWNTSWGRSGVVFTTGSLSIPWNVVTVYISKQSKTTRQRISNLIPSYWHIIYIYINKVSLQTRVELFPRVKRSWVFMGYG